MECKRHFCQCFLADLLKIKNIAILFKYTNISNVLVAIMTEFITTVCVQVIVLFVETPHKFITAKLSIRKPGSSSVLIICRSSSVLIIICANNIYVVFPQKKLLYI